MAGHDSFQRFAAITGIPSFFFAMASNVLQGIPVHFNPGVFGDPTLFLSVGSEGARLLHLGLILDMFGYYLLLLPLAIFLQRWFEAKQPAWIRFYTACGFGYILVGATGAVTLAVVQPPLINAYLQASVEQRVVLETVFGTVWNIVYRGVWNALGGLLIGVWFAGVGLTLRSELRGLGTLGILTGALVFLDSVGTMSGIEGLAFLGLSIYLLLAPIWALWMGITLLRNPIRIPQLYGEVL